MHAVLTRPKLTDVSKPRRHFGKQSMASFVVVAACAFTSATASAGIREYSEDNPNSAAQQTSSFAGSVMATYSPVRPDSDAGKFAPGRIDLLLSDPSADNSFSRSLFLANNPTPAVARGIDKSVAELPGAAPKSGKNALLIPLPTAISAGTSGLIALALLLAPQRLRRRLLA
jgi:hypothetical protein